VAVLAALLVGGGWWVVRGPMVDKPTSGSSDLVVDEPVLLDSSVTTAASSPSHAGPLALSGARAASVAGPPVVVERCGDEQRPEYGSVKRGPFDVTVVTKPAGLAYTAAQARIDAALRASADPFDRAVADLVNVGDMRTPEGALDAVVQDALATSDPRIYSLAFIACVDSDARTGFPTDGPPPPPSCAKLSVRRWTQLEPDNGVPWLAAIQEAHGNSDPSELADALAHLVAASRFEGRLHAAAGAVLQQASASAQDAAAVGDLASRAIALDPVGSTLRGLCNSKSGADEARLAQCAAIATTMFEHTDSQMAASAPALP